MQGSLDAVVPPAQAEDMVNVIKDRGGDVEYVIFDGEGHGWRQAVNMATALETEIKFYERILMISAD